MKKILLGVLCIILFASCSKQEVIPTTYNKLFYVTDTFVDFLEESSYNSYDALGKKQKETSDGVFLVTPMGRMIAVKIKKTYEADYDTTLRHLKTRYASKKKVKDIYKNSGGTITIDCRR